jgi:hypothetical protein
VSRRALQVVAGLLGLLPIVTGGLSLALGPRELPDPGAFSVDLDSNYRFYAAFWFGAGVLWWREVLRIERAGPLFRALCGMFVLGGLGRLLSIAQVGMPAGGLVGAIVAELVLVPALIPWQAAVARAAAAPTS